MELKRPFFFVKEVDGDLAVHIAHPDDQKRTTRHGFAQAFILCSDKPIEGRGARKVLTVNICQHCRRKYRERLRKDKNGQSVHDDSE